MKTDRLIYSIDHNENRTALRQYIAEQSRLKLTREERQGNSIVLQIDITASNKKALEESISYFRGVLEGIERGIFVYKDLLMKRGMKVENLRSRYGQ